VGALIIPYVSILAIVCACHVAHAQEKPRQPARRMTWGETPAIRFGSTTIEPRVMVQGDSRDSDVAFDGDDARVFWARKRAGVSGVIAGALGFEVVHDIGGGVWRDVYVNYQQFDAIQVMAGQFKMPFSRERLTSPARLDFVYRARVVDTLAPGRDRGVMVHGRVWRSRIGYELGVFANDGEADRTGPDYVSGGRTVATRVTARPFRGGRPRSLRTLEFGAAGVWTDVSEGLTSFEGETAFGEDFYEPFLWVRGAQRRQGLEARWRPGVFSVNTEYIRLTTERRGQSVEGTDLSPFVASGWYLSGTWIVTGEQKNDGPELPRRPFPRGPGSIEAAARIESFEFSSAARDDVPSASPRADVVLGNRLEALTLGINWYPMRWVRLQFNAIRESLRDPLQGPSPSQSAYWNRVVRFQFRW
jgi:phosphate-selective porin OprO/OprP